MGMIVITKRGKEGSYIYKAQSAEEFRDLGCALSRLDKDGLQIVCISSIDAYGEYKPAIEITSIPELFLIAGKEALDTI